MKAISGGLDLGSEFKPEKLCSLLRDERYQWRVEPGCGSEFNPEK